MSDFQMKEGQCFIYKVKADGNKPAVKGKAMINGQEYEISLWDSKSGKAGSYSGKIALPFKPKKQQENAQSSENFIEDEIAFQARPETS